MFGLGNLFGITLASFLITIFFQSYSGSPEGVPDPEDPAAFGGAINTTFLVATGIGMVVVTSSTPPVYLG